MWFRIIPSVNRYYFPKQHYPVDLCNGEDCALFEVDLIPYYLDEFEKMTFQRFILPPSSGDNGSQKAVTFVFSAYIVHM
jgi:hypothetical protein